MFEKQNFPVNAGKYFGKLFELKCIVCELNKSDTIPSNNVAIEKLTTLSDQTQANKKYRRKIIIDQIADDYGINSKELLKEFQDVFNEPVLNKQVLYTPRDEEQIEKQLKRKELIPPLISYTRKAFWKTLADVKVEALQHCENMECINMSQEKSKEFELKNEKAIKLYFGIKSNNLLYVLYNPMYDSRQQLEAAKKIMFSKEYVTRILKGDRYHEEKKHFESNKIAQLNLENLRKVDLKQFGKLDKTADLDRIHITNVSDQTEIWNYLKKQEIIDEFGYYFKRKKGKILTI